MKNQDQLIDHTVYRIRESCLEKLNSVHSDLQDVIMAAREIAEIDFIVAEGRRTSLRQRRLCYKGEEKTEAGPMVYGLGCFLLPQLDGLQCFSVAPYIELATSVRYASQNLSIPICWGGLPLVQNLGATEDSIEDLMFSQQYSYTEEGKTLMLRPSYFELSTT